MIKVIYNKTCGRCVQSEPLTSGMVGQTIELEYSADFDGLTLTAVFTNGKTTVDVLNPGNQCVIPHEVLDTVGTLVKVGVYAVRGNELVIPTVYSNIGTVLKGADPSGDVSADPTLPVWAQMQGIIGNLNDLNTGAKDNLVAAVNEVKHTADSKQDKLIAGDNITISADGRTISATGGSGSIIELDTTLSEAGKAADAKAVGDALAEKQPIGDYLTQNELQDATNAALAQAKESGEFDGADGAPGVYYGTTQPTGDTHPVWIDSAGGPDDGGLLPAVTAADNGKVLRVVNSAWSAEDMPTGGTDMGITGATVGQIAKITAVDDTGKPTAWEPVDMPTGGSPSMSNDWLLLADITLSEDAAVIKIDKTPSGGSFSIHELAFFGGIKCDTINKTLTLSMNGNIGYGNPTITLGTVLNAAETGTESVAVYVNVLPECVFSRTQHNAYNTAVGKDAPTFSASNLRVETQVAYSTIGNPLSVFAIAPWANGQSGVFKAGTSLKFYGR